MTNRKSYYLSALLLLTMSLLLAACDSGSVEEAVGEAGQVLQDNAGEIAEQAEQIADTAAEIAEEAMDDADSAMEETNPCTATEGGLAGVDITGTTFEWWYNHRGDREELLLPLLDEFNATNECGVTIVGSSQGSYNDIREKVNGNIASGGELPALVVGYQNDQAFYQLNDTLVDLDTYIEDPYWGLSEEERADFYASFFEQSVHELFGNQRLGFPPNRSMEVLYINETFMNELGYDTAPTTPEEFREISCAGAAANGDGTGGFIISDDASALASWALAFGGDVVDADGNYDYNNDATVAAMTMLKEMMDEGCAFLYTDGFPNPELAARRAVFTMGSTSGLPFYIDDFNTIAEEEGRDVDSVAIAAIPHTTAEPAQNIYGGDVMIVNSTPEEQLAAWYFIKWFTSPEIQARWVEISNYFPTRRATSEFLTDYVDANEVWATAAELLPYGRYEPQLVSYQGVRDEAANRFNEILQGEDIVETLQALDDFANELQEELMAEIEG